MCPCCDIGDIVVKDGRGAPDRRIDDPAPEPRVAGPFGSATALHEFGRGADAVVVAVAHPRLVSGAPAKIQWPKIKPAQRAFQLSHKKQQKWRLSRIPDVQQTPSLCLWLH